MVYNLYKSVLSQFWFIILMLHIGVYIFEGINQKSVVCKWVKHDLLRDFCKGFKESLY
jgi:ABC-type uncharacterized transport system substrate-binding protein